MPRLKFAVYGNCQIEALVKILQRSAEFSQNYEHVPVTAVHRISQSEESRFAETIRDLDLFIHQPVAAAVYGDTRRLGTDHLLTRLKGGARAISFPSAYFSGYNPETIVWKDESGNNVWDSFCNYHDLNVLNAYYHGMSWQECVSYVLSGASYAAEFLEANVVDSLDRLRQRERQIDVTISDFVQESWQNERLFFGFNHPSNYLLLHEANQILEMIGLSKLDRSALVGHPEFMAENNDVLFIYPAVRKHFGLRFAEEAIRVRGRTYTLDGAVKGYFDYYSTHPELVQLNMHRYQNSSDATLSTVASYWARRALDRVPAPGASPRNSNSGEQDARINDLLRRLEGKNRVIASLQSSLDYAHSRLEHGKSRVDSSQREPDTMGPDAAVGIPGRLYPVVNRLAPPGTTRRYYGKLVLTGIRTIKTEGWGAFLRKGKAWLRARRVVRDAPGSGVPRA
jgi:Polysaccharide biosynthesis enzyme WcbI